MPDNGLDPADKIEEAQRRYFKSPKGKSALRKYYNSEKGQSRRKERKALEVLMKECSQFLLENPDKSPSDFLKEVLNNG